MAVISERKPSFMRNAVQQCLEADQTSAPEHVFALERGLRKNGHPKLVEDVPGETPRRKPSAVVSFLQMFVCPLLLSLAIVMVPVAFFLYAPWNAEHKQMLTRCAEYVFLVFAIAFFFRLQAKGVK